MKRISTLRSDPGALAWELIQNAGCAVNVTLDGVPQPQVITADEDEGLVVRFVSQDPVGAIRAGLFPIETVRGVVKIAVVTPVAAQRAAKRKGGK